MNKLFTDFKPADYETWINQLKKDLKDKPLEALESNSEKEISIRAYYHPVKDRSPYTHFSLANNFAKNGNNWSIRRAYAAGQTASMLNDLNEGIDAIGLSAQTSAQFSADQQGVLFEHIVSDIRFESKEAAMEIAVHPKSILNFDIISLNACAGKMLYQMDDFIGFFVKRDRNKCLWVDGFTYGESGASTVQELAFTLAHLNEYVHALRDRGVDLSTIQQCVVLQLSVNDNYFVNLAKFRAIRELTALLFSAYDASLTPEAPFIYAKNSARFLAINDSNNNLLRQSTQAMSAILGGCDVLTLSPLKLENESANEIHQRMAKNIPLVLREESYFDKVVDPAAGSMFIEHLTDQLIEKSWALFNEIEHHGGLLASLQDNSLQKRIEENQQYLIEKMRSGKQVFLGVNKYPSSLETWTDVKPLKQEASGTFKALTPFSLEAFHLAKTLAS